MDLGVGICHENYLYIIPDGICFGSLFLFATDMLSLTGQLNQLIIPKKVFSMPDKVFYS